MKRLTVIAILALALLPGADVAAEERPIVVVLSWDGMRHDYLDRAEFPALSRIAKEGVRAERLKPVFPSSTFPGHVSMATGTYPDRHGIVDNIFLDQEKGRYAYSGDADWIEAEPLWIASERQGVPTATYFWVGSESDWRGQGTSYRVAPFDSKRAESVKVDQILEWLALPEAERPRLIMSYWAGADSVGHDDGPNSESITEQIEVQDAELSRLLAGIDELDLWARTTLILVSDHGMAAATKALDLGSALTEAGIDAFLIGSTVGQIHLKAPVADDDMRRVLEEFLEDVPGSKVYKNGELPADLRLQRPDRLGDWVVALPPPYWFRASSWFEGALMQLAFFLGKELGMHGYDPALPDMGGVFLAMGRGVRGAPLGEVHQVDVAATVAALLDIEPPEHSEGRAIW